MVLEHVRKKIKRAKDMLSRLHAGPTIRYGSMFTGLDAPGVALTSIFGPAVQHVFAIEKNKACQLVIRASFDVQIIETNVLTVAIKDLPEVDAFHNRPPCQSY